jgi:hypothetical protein
MLIRIVHTIAIEVVLLQRVFNKQLRRKTCCVVLALGEQPTQHCTKFSQPWVVKLEGIHISTEKWPPVPIIGQVCRAPYNQGAVEHITLWVVYKVL